MKIFGFNLSIARASSACAEVKQRSWAMGPGEWLRGEDLDTGPLLSNAYEQVVWVYRAINALAEQLANAQFLFSEGARGSENLITAGPSQRFYNRPHPQINRFQYWELRVIWLMLRGECFRIPICEQTGPGSKRSLRQVLILDPSHFQHVIEDNRLMG